MTVFVKDPPSLSNRKEMLPSLPSASAGAASYKVLRKTGDGSWTSTTALKMIPQPIRFIRE